MQQTIQRRHPTEVMQSIYSYLKERKGQLISPTEMARETGLNYNACKQYLDFMISLQSMEKINFFKTPRGEQYVLGGLSSLDEKQQNRVLKEGFGLDITESDKLYLGLMERNITSPENAVKLEMTKTIEEGLKLKHLDEVNGKIYLTEIGQLIAQGTKKIFEL